MAEDTSSSFSCEPPLDVPRLEAGLAGGEGLGDFLVLTGEELGEQEEPLVWCLLDELFFFFFT